MTEHAFAFTSADTNNVTFTCPKCGKHLVLNKPGVGEPAAIDNSGEWEVPPEVLPNTRPCEPPIDNSAPLVISKRQFLIQLARAGMVDPSEAATLPTQPPAMMQTILDAMSTEDALEAVLSWASMTEIERYSPLVLAAASANNISAQDLDNFFAAAAAI